MGKGKKKLHQKEGTSTLKKMKERETWKDNGIKNKKGLRQSASSKSGWECCKCKQYFPGMSTAKFDEHRGKCKGEKNMLYIIQIRILPIAHIVEMIV